QSKEASDIHQCVFLSAHRTTVRECECLLGNFQNGAIRVARLTVLDKICILRKSASIYKKRNSILATDSSRFFHVLHRDRLSAARVVGDRDDTQGNFV